jgi:hypothetical protein
MVMVIGMWQCNMEGKKGYIALTYNTFLGPSTCNTNDINFVNLQFCFKNFVNKNWP